MEVLNERAFRQLIKIYKSITIIDIINSLNYDNIRNRINLHKFLNGITGFGSFDTCTLCRATIERVSGMIMPADCDKCLYVYTTDIQCNYGPNSTTYDKLTNSSCSPEMAIKYINERSEYMLSVYDDYLRKVINETEIELNNIICDGDDSYSDNAGNQIEYILQLERRLKCFNKKMDILHGKGL